MQEEMKKVAAVPGLLIIGMLDLISCEVDEVEVSFDTLQAIKEKLQELDDDDVVRFYKRQIDILTT